MQGRLILCAKGKNITWVLQKIREQMEAASEVGEMMGSMEEEG